MPGNTTVTGKAQAMDPTSGHVTTYSEVRCRAVGVVRVRVALFGVSKYMCSWYQNVMYIIVSGCGVCASAQAERDKDIHALHQTACRHGGL